ncbi:beta strand repeat-containing protein, partial [Candidatus Omnitrophota bacterium]
ASLDATSSVAGAITVDETNAIVLTDVDTADGLVRVDAAGQITAVDVDSSATDDDTNNIALTSTGAGIEAQYVNAGSNNDAVLDAQAGAITNDDATTSDVIADVLIADATAGIDLDTTIASLDATSSVAGAIAIDETNAIILTDVDTADGLVRVDAAGQITAVDVDSSATDDDTNSIALTSTGAGIEVQYVNAGSNNDAVLDAQGGAITNDGGVTPDVIADVLTADATAGIDLDTTIASLDATSSVAGAIAIDETDTIGLTGVDTASGAIRVDAAGQMTATSVAAGGSGNVSLTTTTGDVIVVSVTAAGDNVGITSAGKITSGSAGANVTAGDLTAQAADNVGALGNYLNTAVSTMDITASNGGAFVEQTGDLQIQGLSATDTINVIGHNSMNLTAAVNVNVGASELKLEAAADLSINNDLTTTGELNLIADRTNAGAGKMSQGAATKITATAGDINLYSSSQEVSNVLGNMEATTGHVNFLASTGQDTIYQLNTTVLRTIEGGSANGGGDVTIGPRVTLRGGVATISIWRDWVNGGTFEAEDGAIGLNGTGTIDNSGFGEFNSVDVRGTYDMASTVSVTSNVIITAGGTLDVKGFDLEADKLFSNAGTLNCTGVGSVVNIEAGDVDFIGTGAINAAGTDVTIDVLTGDITCDTTGLDISANNLTITSQGDVGASALPLYTAVSAFDITSTTGGVYLDQTGDLDVNGLSTQGPITIIAHSDINVNNNITLNIGDIPSLTSFDILIGASEDININAHINVASVDEANLIFKADYFATDANTLGAYNQAAGTNVRTNSGSISIAATGTNSNIANLRAQRDLTISSSQGLDVVYTVGSTIDVEEDVILGDNVTVNAGDSDWFVGEDWTNNNAPEADSTGALEPAGFVPQTSTVEFDSNSSSATVTDTTISGYTEFNNLKSSTPGKKFYFATSPSTADGSSAQPSGEMQVIGGDWRFESTGTKADGTANDPIEVSSQTPGTRWYVSPTGPIYLTNVVVKDSHNDNGSDSIVSYPAPSGMDGGNNRNWFEAEPVTPPVVIIPEPPEPPTPPGPGEVSADIAIGAGFLNLDFEEGKKKYRKWYRGGKYKTTVIVYEGKVVASPYDEDGAKYDEGVTLTNGESTSIEDTIEDEEDDEDDNDQGENENKTERG